MFGWFIPFSEKHRKMAENVNKDEMHHYATYDIFDKYAVASIKPVLNFEFPHLK